MPAASTSTPVITPEMARAVIDPRFENLAA